jgi:hypothetical protein
MRAEKLAISALAELIFYRLGTTVPTTFVPGKKMVFFPPLPGFFPLFPGTNFFFPAI